MVPVSKNKEEPLKLSSRGHTGGGREEFPAPRGREVAEHQEVLKSYLNEVKGIKSRLGQFFLVICMIMI